MLALLAGLSPAFPTYEDPLTIGPPALSAASLPVASCSVKLFDNVGLKGYGQVENASYFLPAACPPPWSSVLLEWEGSIAGVQASLSRASCPF